MLSIWGNRRWSSLERSLIFLVSIDECSVKCGHNSVKRGERRTLFCEVWRAENHPRCRVLFDLSVPRPRQTHMGLTGTE